MILHRTTDTLTLLAPAKVNLSLCVHGRRSDGFHELETVMVGVGLYDELCCSPTSHDSSAIELSVNSPDSAAETPSDRRNLVVRALELLQATTGCQQGMRVRLTKRIPAAAGLGGGSSDAASALVAGNLLWHLKLSTTELSRIASQIGSDVPFFLSPRAAVCRGRGELVTPFEPQRRLPVVIVKPPAGLSTADVYANFSRASGAKTCKPVPESAELLRVLTGGMLNKLGRFMRNDLQPAALALCPKLAQLRDAWERLPVVAHQLSGSGTAYFAICHTLAQARRLARLARQRGWGQAWATLTC
jgi:4-diphosphocytidyl-2-C-methyl-D-erythritol kinase